MASFFKKIFKETEKLANNVAKGTEKFAENVAKGIEKGLDKIHDGFKQEKKIVEKQIEKVIEMNETVHFSYQAGYSNYYFFDQSSPYINIYSDNYAKSYNTQYDTQNNYMIPQNKNLIISSPYIQDINSPYPSFN